MSLQLHFDPNQQYQLDAIQSVVDLFDGQPLAAGEFSFSLENDPAMLLSEMGLGNHLALTNDQLLTNLQAVQQRNNLPVSADLQGSNYSIEMETGTGKTYVYLRTIYELNQQYGFTKFVIVVPSIAIREGVLKNLEITQQHFASLYSRKPAQYQQYSSARVSSLRSFASSNAIQILVINIDAFAKDANVINRANDKLSGKQPLEFIQATHPIVIVDEPQNMETDKRQAAIASLDPLYTLRYSATHLNLYNPVYTLNPVQAYDLGLVKQIEVDSVTADSGIDLAYVRLDSIKPAKRSISARITLEVDSKTGVKHKTVTAKPGDDLFDLSQKRPVYQNGYIVNNIDATAGFIELSNGNRLYAGQNTGAVKDQIMRVQLHRMVDEHFQKARRLEPHGIKVLSLIFIDRVANYRHYTEDNQPQLGKIAQWFQEFYEQAAALPENRGLFPFPVEQVHDGYFAEDKGKLKDSVSGTSKADESAYELIMRDKERLLDIHTPLRFIFSHSALREGWDNPNVFQICTLNETRSDMKKRQEIGRGLRLCVGQNGLRVYDRAINRLTVFANQSYEEFARDLQTEIEQDTGVKFEHRILNRSNRQQVKVRKGYQLDQNFLDLWNRIKHKTRYRVQYSSAELIAAAAQRIQEMPPIPAPRIRARRAQLQLHETGVTGQYRGEQVIQVQDHQTEIPDLLGYVQSRTQLTRQTILSILKRSGRLADALVNPQLFLDRVVYHVNNVLQDLMVAGIKYRKVAGEEYDMLLFESQEIESYLSRMYEVQQPDKTLADYIVFDSVGVEQQFAIDCENDERVQFYIKLPGWFKIPTPLGQYNPDWALIFKDEKRLYFVAETKSVPPGLTENLRNSEKAKIKCGEAHFREFDDVDYRQIQKLSDLP